MNNDRCDIEFTYKTTCNTYLDYIIGTPAYFINAGDKLTLTLKNIVPSKVTFKTNSYSLDLTNDNNTWSTTIPTSYTNKESFAIILNDNTILYQGLLNYPTTTTNDLETQVNANTQDISMLKIEYSTIIENLQNFMTSTNLKLENLEDRVSALENAIDKEY